MRRRLITPDDFANAVRHGSAAPEAVLCRAAPGDPEFGANGRTVGYTLSTPVVARDNHTIAADAWQTDNYLRNPVFLWCHDDSQLPIGRMVELGTVGDALKGVVEYADRDLNPFADMVYQLVRAGYLNAVSVSWGPIAYRFSTDKSRPGGIDFTKVDLFEVSQVPLPANPDALAEARRAGIDTGPLRQWAERLLDTGDSMLIPRHELETLRRAAKMPAPATSTRSVPEPAAPAVEPVASAPTARNLSAFFKRGLYHVGWLAWILEDLDCLTESVNWEAALEEDGSAVPAMMAEAMQKLGAILIAMTTEEVAELIADPDTPDPDGTEDDAVTRGILHALGRLHQGDIAVLRSVRDVLQAHRRGDRLIVTNATSRSVIARFGRTGRVLSAENERCLRDAHDMMTRGCEMVRSVFEQCDAVVETASAEDQAGDSTASPTGMDNEEEQRAIRARRARALIVAGELFAE
jgi:HK97 family phage prohead protease